MVGITGAGKTTFATRFAQMFGAPIISQTQLQIEADITHDQAQTLSHILLQQLLKTGRTIVFDGATYQKKQRQALVKKVAEAGYIPLLVWVQTESIEAKRRSSRRNREGGALSDAEFDADIKRFSPPTVQEKCIVISGKHTYTSQVKVVLKRIAGARPQPEISEGAVPRVRTRNIILR